MTNPTPKTQNPAQPDLASGRIEGNTIKRIFGWGAFFLFLQIATSIINVLFDWPFDLISLVLVALLFFIAYEHWPSAIPSTPASPEFDQHAGLLGEYWGIIKKTDGPDELMFKDEKGVLRHITLYSPNNGETNCAD